MFRWVFCQQDNSIRNQHARYFPGTGPRAQSQFWGAKPPRGRSDQDLITLDVVSKMVFRDPTVVLRRYVRILLVELPNEIGAALIEQGFSQFAALEMLYEAALELRCREAFVSKALTRTQAEATVTEKRNAALIQEALHGSGQCRTHPTQHGSRATGATRVQFESWRRSLKSGETPPG